MILPISVMVFTGLAGLTRLIRVSMIDALSQDYTRTARAKGLREGAVIFSHAFRNAQLPFVTSIAGSFIAILSGSIILEEIFSVSGMGRLFIDSLRTLDFNVALAISTILTVITLVGYLLLDFVYLLVDPRVKLE
jgi:peptide/nickel transport system permease protein